MFAIIQTGGKQYKVSPGDKIKIEKLASATGGDFIFDKVLLVANDKDVKIGNPFVKGAKVEAKVLKQGLPLRKVIIEKSGRDAEINWLRNLKNNEIFYRFLKEKKHFLITNMELRNLLRCTLETPLRIVKQNLVYSINLAEEFKEKELLKFLKFCQQYLPKK